MRMIAILSTCLLSVSVFAETFRYTNTETGNNLIPLGYEVPIPVDSLTPVDGFRTYQSLHLRHQQLVAETDLFESVQVGQTYYQRPIWAYVLGDDDRATVSGATEGAALINGGIHAREWQSPEALTGYMEYLFEQREDQHLSQYLLENLNLVLLPVLNVDGFLQTQRFPDLVTSTQQQPRDGRMRRKNMREVDEVLTTEFDNQRGVDLNRNNAPYWATDGQRSSDEASSIVHHGSGPGSEPEIAALQYAAQLSEELGLRFYIDTHSFTQIYFTHLTANVRRNGIAEQLATIMRAANNYKYDYGPSAAGVGIGTTAEYFANTYQIPAYTHEIEPKNSAADYGGFGVSHDGFILPNDEVARMRQETRKASIAGLYAIAEVPILMEIEIWDSTQNSLVLRQLWQKPEGSTRRILQTIQASPLLAQTPYRLNLVFNKPMRQITEGQVVAFSNLSRPQDLVLKLIGEAQGQALEWPLDSTSGQWLISEGFKRYKSDTYALEFTLDSGFTWSSLSLLALELSATDMVGQALDSNPATVVDWQFGAWSNYEDEFGDTTTDSGGTDRSMRLIDDGSEVFLPPLPSQQVPSQNQGGSGGEAAWLLVLMLALLCYRQQKRLIND